MLWAEVMVKLLSVLGRCLGMYISFPPTRPDFFFFFFFLFGCIGWHAGSLFPDQGLNLCPLQWKHGILITTTREIPIWGLLSGLQGNEMSHLPGLTRQSPESSSTSPEIFSTLYYEYSAKELPGKRKDVLIVTEIKFSIYSSVCKRQGKLCIKCLP